MAGGAQDTGDEAITGINVTPLVDVTLVLLIIFMVTTKMIVRNQSIPLELPKAQQGAQQKAQAVIFSIELGANGQAAVDGKTIPNDDAIFPLAKDSYAKNQDVRAVIKADSAVTHGRVIHVLDQLKKAGMTKIAFGVSPVAPDAPQK
jgi:biopolymer transport protein ExbD